MYRFKLNGKEVVVEEDKNLLEYLREDARLTSVKNGCGEGACGACMILVDGNKVRACLLTTSKVHEKSILTVEGLSKREKDLYTWAFSEAGAVQCGFCIPGMVISAKGLLDNNLNPTRKEIKEAIKGNVCRCTGYVKIEKAIAMVAKALRENFYPLKREFKGIVGESIYRIDVEDKVLGTGQYVDDMQVDGMLYGGAVRTRYPRALVKKIDIKEAEAYPGVVAVITAKDIPGNRFIGHLVKDWPAMIAEGEETRYIGDAVALVAAKSKKILREAINKVNIEYEELKPFTCPEEAMKQGAAKIHAKGNILKKEVLKRGNVDEAIKKSKYVVTEKYSTPFTEHAFLEPEAAIAMPYEDGVLIYTGGQGIYDDQREVSELLGLEAEKVRVISKYVGGGFGGKEDMSVQHHAALLAWYTKKPVKVILSRKESILVHPKRHAAEMEFTTACDENGKLTAMRARIVTDTGAYASLGGPVLQRLCTHAAGPYNYQNVDIEGIAVYTNNPPAGAFRGFGVTQSIFATECNLNLLAQKIGISHWEIRYINALKPGDILPNGQIAGQDTAIVETLLAVKEEYEKNTYAGIACAIKNSGLGVGIPDTGRCRLTIIDGKIHIRTSAACIGQGMATIVLQMVCETLKVSPDKVVVDVPDTAITPNSGTTTASRQTVFTGEATKKAALKLKEALKVKSIEELEGQDFYGEYLGVTDPMGSDKPNPVSHVAYGYGTQVVILDEKGFVIKVVAAHDVGKAINPISVEGQIEGGVVMGLGYALTENYPLKNSIPKAKFGTLGLFRSTSVPEIKSIIIEKNTSSLAYGAKGVGEITTIPTAPAVQGAYMKLDGKFRNKLPLEDTAYRKKK
ncbi:selenium-dependent xanthine dehydrogenase [Clostridium tetanomorphum]|uniref:selenium-dependent xanthine dehydrogenase n=1 Tax=Clostridium tetanomorphum TaxID=1553 RepID=UPI000445879B|nr:selenium-dependent xanthine dehydrogenase [Clostridium tetanomorphum]KAJ49084.1 xanthine dehydrogenase, molybdopterin-binding subunit [Clostridium tetanomorphum DSM 665]KAJ52948.1 xanthine dehydrogenase, molybdopterin-binding subunit [Clostridium tetanomorphum DSM 665]MBP1864888.1 selenium-dependent xanthine dehydrogenase [Clostridium tetanomorphum]NRS83094.1 selenium-dependent xanthine dehydrogenase [Clostridium tetanomorphum]SQC01136.1 selenium-dependent molybdenum hydroxylase 1 [Clostrid